MRGRQALAGVTLMLLASTLALPQASVAAGNEYRMETKATYLVQPAKRMIAVSVKVTFTNTTPDPAGKFSVFESVPLALQDGARSAAARDGKGELKVELARDQRNDVNIAAVSLRAPLRFNKSTTFTLTYSLPDGGVPSLRIRPSAIVFPAWSFGTKGDVRIDLPSAYEVLAAGDHLTASTSGDTTVLQSGTIATPASWLAQVTATQPSAYVTLSRSVTLKGGSADLQVRSWQDDPEWGDRTLELLAGALPRLEAAIGVPYPHVGPLVVTESAAVAPAGIGEPAGESDQELQVIFDEPAFTALHELAHVWIGSGLAADRWIREGLASYYAEKIAAELKVKLPYDPATQLTRLKADAFPLAGWALDEPPERDRYGYAASWALIDEIAGSAGAEAISLVLQRTATGVDSYQPVTGGTTLGEPGHAAIALDSRRFLDQLERVSPKPISPLFVARVLTAADVALLPKRTEAHTAFGRLVAAAGDWGTPAPIRQRLSDWDFDGALPMIAAATGWLKERDALVARVEATGLTAPQRLKDRYVESGGGAASKAELEAEGAVASAYVAALGRANRQRSLVERIGLAAGPEPSARLAAANALFASGDLAAAADATAEAQRALDGAGTAGWLRLASVIVALAAIVGLLVALTSRSRWAEASAEGDD
jgi:hypothetical protein